ncbi:MAG: NCAIR mutase (PurE)-related protein [Planctomycetota bacterium]|jgi:NCAIR mutase (PurE)-related protein
MSSSRDVLLLQLMQSIENGELDAQSALSRWHDQYLAPEKLGFQPVHADLSRGFRSGFPEVVYGEGKEPQDLLLCLRDLMTTGQPILVTRINPEQGQLVTDELPGFQWHKRARMLVFGEPGPSRGKVSVIAAGTTDLPVAEEAAVTASMMGAEVQRIYDVGVAGLHRLLSRRKEFESAAVHIVVAGMEGALPSVVGGLVAEPVIAVPTSVGYGASFEGIAALLGMLCSCAPGVVVVNIGNGFGAGYAACRMLSREFERTTRNQQGIRESE